MGKLEEHSSDVVTRVADDLRTMVLRGVLPANARLKQDELASQLGVSRTPLRHAIRQLSHEGLIDIRHYKSARVTEVSALDVEDLFDMRIAMEPKALSAAFDQLDKVELAKAEQCLDDVDPAPRKRVELAQANWRFHKVLYAPCKRPLLLSVIEELNIRASRPIVIGLSVKSRPQASHQEHLAILAACRERQKAKAIRLLTEHLIEARAATLEAIQI
jgi:DNA-binding GntR family transcriptional regulator